MSTNPKVYVVSGANINVTHSAQQSARARNVPHVTIPVRIRQPSPQPSPQYREEWRTRYYGDSFSHERVLVPVNGPADEDGSFSAIVRGLVNWLFG